ncbi:hypothetical protein AMAG_10064 [Allomyces macrogynus ATCC 38327]|uniref:Uncharacterized protein n=1 Tax=Allomyces macrogynus (strain ATCC 38327) TaxID=578462 RepID=A0A0L0SQ85_ALLM3|nr:hypothetical protein AMAG_10064 [Allomyces macrogynus ATCC 38327]|eukprot:KNE64713.1 hypothetical protein AMAG_10064 [Allomyces macrogynus ATCC 38327]
MSRQLATNPCSSAASTRKMMQLIDEDEINEFEDFVADITSKMDKIMKGDPVPELDALPSNHPSAATVGFGPCVDPTTMTKVAETTVAEWQVPPAATRPEALQEPVKSSSGGLVGTALPPNGPTPSTASKACRKPATRFLDYSRFDKINPDAVDTEAAPKDKSAAAPLHSATPTAPDPLKFKIERVVKTMTDHSDRGTAAATRGDWSTARDCYLAAVASYFKDSAIRAKAANMPLRMQVHRVHANLAQAYLQLGDSEAAALAAQTVLSHSPPCWKAHWRYTLAYRRLVREGKRPVAEWVAVVDALRKIVIVHKPKDLPLALVLKEDADGRAEFGLSKVGSGKDSTALESASAGSSASAAEAARSTDLDNMLQTAKTLLEAKDILATLAWLACTAFPTVERHPEAVRAPLDLAMFRLVTMVQDATETPRVLATSPTFAAWIQHVWETMGAAKPVATAITSLIRSPLGRDAALLTRMDAGTWLTAAAHHVRELSALPVDAHRSALVDAMFALSTALKVTRPPWDLVEAVANASWVAEEAKLGILANVLRMRPDTAQSTALAALTRVVERGAVHAVLWSKLGRLGGSVREALVQRASEAVDAARSTAAWSAVVQLAVDVQDQTVSAAVLDGLLDRASDTIVDDDTVVGNAALLVARVNVPAATRSRWARLLLDALRMRYDAVRQRRGDQVKVSVVADNVAIALAKLCRVDDDVRQWVRESGGIELMTFCVPQGPRS